MDRSREELPNIDALSNSGFSLLPLQQFGLRQSSALRSHQLFSFAKFSDGRYGSHISGTNGIVRVVLKCGVA